ncbi:MAG: 50S ribosomal protein L22 [Nitrospirales bacterium]|nr:50S ribosomal protein L22 [Nitrospirales bacterium]
MSEAKAVLRFVRMTPRKCRLIVNLIRGRGVPDALSVLRYMPRAASGVVEKLLRSAVANAGHHDVGSEEELTVVRAFVDVGPTLKRFRSRSMGRANPIHKRTSHITIVVGS